MPNLLTKLLNPTANGPESAQLLANLLNVKISATTLKKEIEEHPDYPSLLSISDVLNAYGIENMGIKFNPDNLNKLPCPFITQLKNTKNTFDFFTVVKSLDDSIVTFFDVEKHQWVIIPQDDFIKRSSGVALLTEVSDKAGEKDYVKKRKEEMQKQIIQYFAIGCFPLILIIAGIITFIQKGTDVLLTLIFSSLTLVGCVVSVLLLWYEVDQYNPVLQQICSAGKKVNCGAVLQSSASKIFGISWSAIGFSYFVGNLLMLFFWGIANPVALFVSALINAVAAPYVLFSVYYQWQIAKQWCVLCLLVQALLVLQLITSLLGGWHLLLPLNTITVQLVLQTFAAFAVPFIAIAILLPALERAKEGRYILNKLQRMKHNRQIFDAFLSKQRKITESPDGLGIVLGNKEGKIKIIKVCSPYCGPCAGAHVPMHGLLQNNPEVRLQMIFLASNEEGNESSRVVNHFMSIAEESDEVRLSQAIDDWYTADIKDYKVFAIRHPVGQKLKEHNAQIDMMANWIDKLNIKGTPTFIINEHILEDIYNIDDIKYFFSV